MRTRSTTTTARAAASASRSAPAVPSRCNRRRSDMTRVGINGFGRVGRMALRAAHEHDADIEWAGVNDVMDVQTAAQLLRYDSTYGPFPGEVEVTAGGLRVDGVEIPFFAASEPA